MMRKRINLFLFLFFSLLSLSAQVLLTTPPILTQSDNSIKILFDASKGTGGLKDYVGTVYAHTGLITSGSASDNDWKYAPIWGDNASKYKLTALGNNKWELNITNIRAYYGVSDSESIQKLAFVFRSGEQVDGAYLEGKDTDNKDLLITVHKTGFAIHLQASVEEGRLQLNESVDFTITATEGCQLHLLLNDSVLSSAANAKELIHSHTFTQLGDYSVLVRARKEDDLKTDTLNFYIPTSPINESRPANLLDGINLVNDSTISFLLYAPNKTNVFLIGDFNNWIPTNAYQMKKDNDYWWYKLGNLDPNRLYRFQYLVDDSIRISDAYAELVLDPWNDHYINHNQIIYPHLPPYPTNKTDGLVACFKTKKTSYNWEIPDFQTASKNNMVIYELLVRDFTTEKSLQAAIKRLGYLDSLGVTAIELLPIQEFDGNSSWGYNPNHFFAPDKAYGPPELYKQFIDECHKRGMAVILDVVPNHATANHPFAKLYWNSQKGETAADNPWFNVEAPHKKYSFFHDFNHEFAGTKEHFKRMLRYWIEEYNIDGYRLDFTKGLTQKESFDDADFSAYDSSRIELLKQYYAATKEIKGDVFFVLEHFADWDEEKKLADAGIYLWRNVNNAFSQSAMGWQSQSSFEGMNASPRQWIGYCESHDEERNFYKAKEWGSGAIKEDSVLRMNRVPLNIAFATLIPGPKMLWQFAEIGYDISIDEGGRTGEKPSGLIWYKHSDLRQKVYKRVATILNLRKKHPKVFDEGVCELNIGTNDWEMGRRIAVKHKDLNIVVLGNFKADKQAFCYPNFTHNGYWYDLVNGQKIDVTDKNMKLNLAPGELRVYIDREDELYKEEEKDGEEKTNVVLFPTLTNDKVFMSSSELILKADVYTLQGQMLSCNTAIDFSSIDLSNLVGGVYIIKVKTEKGNSAHKIIKR